ncbi:MAG: helicase-exonuclease AddAB subunit AddB, partial [Clostridiaceae bacterium]
VLQENRDNFKTFSMSANKDGFVHKLSSIISEFKRFNIDIEKLDIIINQCTDEELRDKINDIKIVYSKFQEKISENYIDSEDDLYILEKKLDSYKNIKNQYIYIDEFKSFTPIQYKILDKILILNTMVNVTLTLDSMSNESIFEESKITENKLIKLCSEKNIPLDKAIELNTRPFKRFESNEEFGFLEKEYYAYPYETYKKKTRDIKIFRAKNNYTEIEFVCKEIINLVRDSNYRYKEIALVSRNLEDCKGLIKAILTEYEIPFFIDSKKDLDSNVIIIFINSILEIYKTNWSYESIFKYLKTGLLDIDKEDIDILENYVLAFGIHGKRRWENKFKNSDEKVENLRVLITKPLFDFYSKVKKKKDSKELSLYFYELLINLNINQIITKKIDDFEKNKNLAYALEYKQIWNILMKSLDQVVEGFKDELLDFESFINILNCGFKEEKIGLIPLSLDEVMVTSVDRLKSHNTKALFIIGVNDGVFPSSSFEEGILKDNERDIMKNLGIEVAKNTSEKTFEENFLIYKTLTMASSKLYISYATSNLEGKALRPSSIVNRVKRLFPSVEEDSDLIKEYSGIDIISSKTPTFNKVLLNIKNKENAGFNKEILDIFKEDPLWNNKYKEILDKIYYENQVINLTKDAMEVLYKDDLTYSVSRFENYVKCPFSYFVRYGLLAKEREIYKFDSQDVGSFMHYILEQFSNEIKASNISFSDLNNETINPILNSILKEALLKDEKMVLQSSPRYMYLTKRMINVLKKTILMLSYQFQKGDFVPIHYEKEFNIKSKYKPLVIQVEDGRKINIVGKIDRVDCYNGEDKDYIRIVDYKTYTKDFDLNDFYNGFQIQLILYLDVALTNEKKNSKPAGVLYFKIDDPIINVNENISPEEIKVETIKNFKMKGMILKDLEVTSHMDKDMEKSSYIIPGRVNKDGELIGAFCIEEDKFNLMTKYVRQKIKKSLEDVLSGNIKIKPYNKKGDTPCSYCKYSAICQFDEKIPGNVYNNIYNLDDDVIWELLDKEVNNYE